MERPATVLARPTVAARLKDVAALFKLRLTFLVVVSCLLGYAMGLPAGAWDLVNVLLLALAGTLVTGSSNAFNQEHARMYRRRMLQTVVAPRNL